MKTKINLEKFHFWMYWTLFGFVFIPLIYMISLIVVILVHGAFGFGQMEGGTYLSQTVVQIAGGATIGLGTGLYQRLLLRRVFDVKASWIYSLVIGFAGTELVVCLLLWQLGINRYELRFIEFNPLPEALIFACAGLLTGLLQWSILRRHFPGSFWWVLASTAGWGGCVLLTVTSVWSFFPGAMIYGAITGAALLWMLRNKELTSD
jgi:hypothetical protein